MSDKKNIDRLFQEKFKDFEAKPNANVWENIQNQLEQTTSKPKVIPLWMRLAGIAALLALLFGLGNAFIGNPITEANTETVVDTNTNEDATNLDNASDTDNTLDKIVSENDIINKNNLANHEISNETLNDNTTVSKENSNNPKNTSSHSESNKNNSATQQAIQNKKKASPNSNDIQSQYASSAEQKNVNTTTNASERATATNKTQSNNASPLYAQNNVKITSDNASITGINNEVKGQNNSVENNSINTINTNPSNEVLAQTNTEEEKTNMNPKDEDAQTPNPLDEATLANTEDSIEKEKEETVMNRWTVNANVAPVYYNTLGKGSHIHDQFINNPKNGEINTSYGINVGYAVNNKLKVRSGINKLNLSYDTADVIIYENVSNTPSSAPLKNIDFVPTNSGENISVLSASSLSVQQVGGVLNDGLNAALSQRISYVEVPVELEYAIVNKRVGVHLIGGVSTLILEGNEVVTEVENRKTKIGEANNINNVSFTTNLGLGIDYKFNDNFKFNIEPTFKYQINAYNETSGDFKPYIIGVYTGFSYKF